MKLKKVQQKPQKNQNQNQKYQVKNKDQKRESEEKKKANKIQEKVQETLFIKPEANRWVIINKKNTILYAYNKKFEAIRNGLKIAKEKKKNLLIIKNKDGSTETFEAKAMMT